MILGETGLMAIDRHGLYPYPYSCWRNPDPYPKPYPYPYPGPERVKARWMSKSLVGSNLIECVVAAGVARLVGLGDVAMYDGPIPSSH